MGLVGESGSGKSTIARNIAGLLSSKDGEIRVGKTGMVFQDSYSALNPKKRIKWLLREALRLRGVRDREEQQRRITEIAHEVEMPEELLERYPSELSGGQRQRVVIAMALLGEPDLLIADEPVSALDVAIQESIMALLKKISTERGMAILFMSHDLRTVYFMCHNVIVLKDGRIVDREFHTGAEKCLEIALRERPDLIVLQPRSPSCGVKQRYDGTFTGTLTEGAGVTAQLLIENGFTCVDADDLEKVL